MSSLQHRRGSLPGPECAAPLISDFQPPEWDKYIFVVCKLLSPCKTGAHMASVWLDPGTKVIPSGHCLSISPLCFQQHCVIFLYSLAR